jgi:hypothetical protein
MGSKMKCPSCGIHAKGSICDYCNSIIFVEPEKVKKVKVKKPLKRVSEKQKAINAAKAKQMKQVKTEREGWCSGCGTPSLLTNSHLVPVGQNKNLELNKLNQVWHCVDRCHPLWEHNKQGRKLMIDYASNMEKIKQLDLEYYNKIVGKNGY